MMKNSRMLLCKFFIALAVLFSIVGGQTNMGNMTMPMTNATTVVTNATTVIANATSNATSSVASNTTSNGTASATNTTTNATAASNATVALQGHCGRLPITAAALNQSVQANGYFLNGSCYLSAYINNVLYPNISSSCTKVMKSTNSTATCQMLQTTNTGPINTLISNKLVQAADRFFIGLSRVGCNGTWKWDNANGSSSFVNITSAQFKGLPPQNTSCGFDNVMYTSQNNNGMLTGSAPNTTGNVLVCECRTDYTSKSSRQSLETFVILFGSFLMSLTAFTIRF